MRHARLQKLQRFRRKMPFYSFLILWFGYDTVEVENGLKALDLEPAFVWQGSDGYEMEYLTCTDYGFYHFVHV